MKKLLVLALLALGLTVVVVPTASSARPNDADSQGPPCSEITNGDGGYSSAGVVDFTVFLQAPTCTFVNYSFFVTDTSGNPVSGTQDANCIPETPDGGCVHFVFDLGTSGPDTVCISATTDHPRPSRGGHRAEHVRFELSAIVSVHHLGEGWRRRVRRLRLTAQDCTTLRARASTARARSASPACSQPVRASSSDCAAAGGAPISR